MFHSKLSAASLLGGTAVLLGIGVCGFWAPAEAPAKVSAATAASPGPREVTSPQDPPPGGRANLPGDPLPPGAVARLGTSRFAHGSIISALAVSPDGGAVATASGQFVCLWGAATGRCLRDIRIHERAAVTTYAVAFSPDGQILACAGNDGVGLWDPVTGNRLRTLAAGRVCALAFSPDGKTLALGHPTGGLGLWEVESGKMQSVLVRPARDVRLRSVAYSPAGANVAVAANDSVVLWDPAKGVRGEEVRVKGVQAHAVAFSPDGTTIASGFADGTVLLRDVKTGEALRDFKAHGDAVTALAFSPDGKTLASGSGGPQEGGAANEKEALRLWEVATGKELRRLGTNHGGVAAVAFNDQGRTLLSASGGRVRLWEVSTGKELLSGGGHLAPVSTVAYAPDGKTLASGGGDRTIRLWEARTGRELRALDAAAPVARLAFAPDGKALASAGSDGAIRLWDASSGRELRVLGSHKPRAYALAFSPDGKTLASGGHDHLVKLWDTATGRQLATFSGLTEAPLALAFSPDGTTLAIAGSWQTRVPTTECPIRLWDVRAGKEVRQLVGHDGSTVHSLAFAPSGKTLASAGSDGSVRFWNLSTGRGSYLLAGVPDVLGQITFSPDGRSLAVAGWYGAHLWEVASARKRRSFTGHRGGVAAVAFSPADSGILASAGGDTTVVLWDTRGSAGKAGGAAPLGDKELEAFWEDLAAADAARSYLAVTALAAAPEQSIPFLRKRLPPAQADPRVPRLLAELDNDEFKVRERATQTLQDLGEGVRPALEKALRAGASPEARRRLESLLNRLSGVVRSSEDLRAIRAAEALEIAGVPDAVELLQALGQGEESARLTREAREAVKRLEKRSGRIP
jgi:WD40 repeat protein